MICSNPNCRKEIPNTAIFCKYCGHKVEEPIIETGCKDMHGLKIAVSLVASLCAIVAIFFAIKLSPSHNGDNAEDETQKKTESAIASAIKEDDVADEEFIPVTTEMIKEANPIVVDDNRIDLLAENYYPRQKTRDLEWDETFFYSFEDTDSLSDDEDNYIAKCILTEQRLVGSDGEEIICEIYTDPNNGVIHKIVTIIEQEAGNYEIVDYYYDKDKPYFAFQRYESVYVPSYAVLKKTGRRFYFNNDVMTKYRIVDEDLNLTQTCLVVQNRPGYQEYCYFDLDDTRKAEYDRLEKEWLNRAYNIRDSIKELRDGTNQYQGTGILSGSLVDSSGNSIRGYTIAVQDISTGKIKYVTTTDTRGCFKINVLLDDSRCRIYVPDSDVYEEKYIYGLTINTESIYYDYGQIILYNKTNEVYQVCIHTYQADDFSALDSDINCTGISTKIRVREGQNNKTGTRIYVGNTDNTGTINLNLKPGTYTIESLCSGFIDTFINIEVREKDCERSIYIPKTVKYGTTTVLMTWDGDIDLDLSVYTPYQASDGEMAYIGGANLSDTNGNSIESDNDRGCEIAHINGNKAGSFKIYVNDYDDYIDQNYDVNVFVKHNVHIYVYLSEGTIYEYTAPSDDRGIVWEVAEISKGRLIKASRIYSKGLSERVMFKGKDGIPKPMEDFLESFLNMTAMFDVEETYEYTGCSTIKTILESHIYSYYDEGYGIDPEIEYRYGEDVKKNPDPLGRYDSSWGYQKIEADKLDEMIRNIYNLSQEQIDKARNELNDLFYYFDGYYYATDVGMGWLGYDIEIQSVTRHGNYYYVEYSAKDVSAENMGSSVVNEHNAVLLWKEENDRKYWSILYHDCGNKLEEKYHGWRTVDNSITGNQTNNADWAKHRKELKGSMAEGYNEGHLIPDFIVYDEDGNAVNSSQFLGKIVYFNFFTTWCPYCYYELPDLQRINDENDDVVVILIDLDESPAEVQEYARYYGVDMPIYYLPNWQVGSYYIEGVPLSIVTDKFGVIHGVRNYMSDYDWMNNSVISARNTEY